MIHKSDLLAKASRASSIVIIFIYDSTYPLSQDIGKI